MPRSYAGKYNRLLTAPVPSWIAQLLGRRTPVQYEVRDDVTVTVAKFNRYSDGTEVRQPGPERTFLIEAGSVANMFQAGSFFISDATEANGRRFQLTFTNAVASRDDSGAMDDSPGIAVAIQAYSGAGHARPRNNQSYLHVLDIQSGVRAIPRVNT